MDTTLYMGAFLIHLKLNIYGCAELWQGCSRKGGFDLLKIVSSCQRFPPVMEVAFQGHRMLLILLYASSNCRIAVVDAEGVQGVQLNPSFEETSVQCSVKWHQLETEFLHFWV